MNGKHATTGIFAATCLAIGFAGCGSDTTEQKIAIPEVPYDVSVCDTNEPAERWIPGKWLPNKGADHTLEISDERVVMLLHSGKKHIDADMDLHLDVTCAEEGAGWELSRPRIDDQRSYDAILLNLYEGDAKLASSLFLSPDEYRSDLLRRLEGADGPSARIARYAVEHGEQNLRHPFAGELAFNYRLEIPSLNLDAVEVLDFLRYTGTDTLTGTYEGMGYDNRGLLDSSLWVSTDGPRGETVWHFGITDPLGVGFESGKQEDALMGWYNTAVVVKHYDAHFDRDDGSYPKSDAERDARNEANAKLTAHATDLLEDIANQLYAR